jgi:hypothetical protein
VGGWPGVRFEESKLRLTHPSLAGTGSELGNIHIIHLLFILIYMWCVRVAEAKLRSI